jgi:hypothetical protein
MRRLPLLRQLPQPPLEFVEAALDVAELAEELMPRGPGGRTPRPLPPRPSTAVEDARAILGLCLPSD